MSNCKKCRCKSDRQLLPSLLYTQANEKVKREMEKDLEVPDPSPEVARAAIDESVSDNQ